MSDIINKLKSRCGETLIEVLISIGIFTLVILTVVTLIRTSQQMLINSNNIYKEITSITETIETGGSLGTATNDELIFTFDQTDTVTQSIKIYADNMITTFEAAQP